MFNINMAEQVPSPTSKIFSTKIGFTVHRSHFDGRHSPPALSRGFNKSRGSFTSHPAAAEPRGIKELSAAPVNLDLFRGAADWSHGRFASTQRGKPPDLPCYQHRQETNRDVVDFQAVSFIL
jgi:hypothetical protein